MTPAKVLGVCGFGRCGSTMAMAMLDAGGMTPVDGTSPGSYEPANRFGTYEISDAGLAGGRTVKLLEHVEYFPLPFLDRIDYGFSSYRTSRPGVVKTLRDHGLLLELTYEDVLAEPTGAALRIRDHLEQWAGADLAARFDVAAAASVVHQRDGSCRPDMSVELAAVGRRP